MPKCHIAKVISYVGPRGKRRNMLVYRTAVLLREDDNFSIYDPANDNELAKNLTPAFVQYLQDKKYLIVEN